jgi:hypothetical protein
MNGEPETARGRATPSPGRLIENKHPIRDAHAHPTRRRRHRGKFALPRSKNVRRPNRKRATSPQRKTDLAPMAADNHQASRATERRSLNTKILAAWGRAEDPSAAGRPHEGPISLPRTFTRAHHRCRSSGTWSALGSSPRGVAPRTRPRSINLAKDRSRSHGGGQ